MQSRESRSPSSRQPSASSSTTRHVPLAQQVPLQHVRGHSPQMVPPPDFRARIRCIPVMLWLVVSQGAGTAHSVQVDSLQPQIVDNKKGLYVSFSIVGVLLGVASQPAALSVTIGDIPPASTAEIRFLLTSTLAVRELPCPALPVHAVCIREREPQRGSCSH